MEKRPCEDTAQRQSSASKVRDLRRNQTCQQLDPGLPASNNTRTPQMDTGHHRGDRVAVILNMDGETYLRQEKTWSMHASPVNKVTQETL